MSWMHTYNEFCFGDKFDVVVVGTFARDSNIPFLFDGRMSRMMKKSYLNEV